jgi:serine O-acetyltransferase
VLHAPGDESGEPFFEGLMPAARCFLVSDRFRIGAHARIGANAVVVKDVPSGAVAVGVPAKNIDEVGKLGTAVKHAGTANDGFS